MPLELLPHRLAHAPVPRPCTTRTSASPASAASSMKRAPPRRASCAAPPAHVELVRDIAARRRARDLHGRLRGPRARAPATAAAARAGCGRAGRSARPPRPRRRGSRRSFRARRRRAPRPGRLPRAAPSPPAARRATQRALGARGPLGRRAEPRGRSVGLATRRGAPRAARVPQRARAPPAPRPAPARRGDRLAGAPAADARTRSISALQLDLAPPSRAAGSLRLHLGAPVARHPLGRLRLREQLGGPQPLRRDARAGVGDDRRVEPEPLRDASACDVPGRPSASR